MEDKLDCKSGRRNVFILMLVLIAGLFSSCSLKPSGDDVAAVVDGQIAIRERMKVTLSSDHRTVDGAVAARFLQEVKRLLEEPFGLLL